MPRGSVLLSCVPATHQVLMQAPGALGRSRAINLVGLSLLGRRILVCGAIRNLRMGHTAVLSEQVQPEGRGGQGAEGLGLECPEQASRE